ncbi:MAG: PadR family transcriptional regulator [Clostridia bacterium]|nr:PadR family transcriptional regulator [Clostridia bacterium]
MDAQMRRALLETCVLASLRGGDSYGYRIVRDVSQYIAVTESTLYPILRRLEAAGCLTVYSEEHNSRLRRYYAITNTGRAKIDEFLAEWEEAMRVYAYIRGTAATTERSETP